MHAQMQRQAHLQAALVVMAEEDMVRAVPDGGPGRAQLSRGVALALLGPPPARGVDHLPHGVQVAQLLPRQRHLSQLCIPELPALCIYWIAPCGLVDLLCHKLHMCAKLQAASC